MSVLSIEHLYYSYDNGKTPVLKDTNFEFEKGKTYAIVGKSGAGKTTLLSLISGLDQSSDGKILYEGQDITKIDREKYRSQNIGVIFQSFNLLRHLTALENVILSMDVAGIKVNDKKHHALEMLRKVGLNEEKANRRVLKLSGGEQQRVAIARALLKRPALILADEPTGELDTATGEEIFAILRTLQRDFETTVVTVTHDHRYIHEDDLVLRIQDGRIA